MNLKIIYTCLLVSISSLGVSQTLIVNAQQFNTVSVPTVPAAWTAGSWNLNFAYATNCHNAASETQTASIAAATYNSYFWIPINFTSGAIYDVNFWRKNGLNMKIVFNETADLTTPISSVTTNNATASWQNLLFQWTSTYTGAGFIGVCAVTGNASRMYVDDLTVKETAPTCTPASQASGLSVTATTSTTATLNWTNSVGSNGSIIIARPTATGAATPSNGNTYLATPPVSSAYGTTQIGTSGNYVVYKGNGTSAIITGLSVSTNYSFEVYSYTSGTNDCYNVTSAPTVNTTTISCDPPATQASNITFSGISAGGMTINWTNSGSGNPVVVVVRPTFWPIDEPITGTTYTANTVYGTLAAQVGNGNYTVYKGTGTSVAITGLHGGINYTVSIYEYAGTSCYNLGQATNAQTTTFSGNIYYVDDNSNTGDIYTPTATGDDTKNGLTATTPKRTLKDLVSTYSGTFTNGDIIYIDAGTYTTEISIALTASGLSFIGAGNNKTFFDRTASTAVNSDWFLHVNGDNIIFKDFTCQGYENQGTQTTAYECGQVITVGGGATAATFINNIYFEDIIFYNNGQSGGNAAIDILSNTSVYIKGGGSYCNVWETAYTGGIGVMGGNVGLTVENYVLAFNFKSGAYDGAGIRIEGNQTTNVKLKNVNIAKNKGVNGGGIGLVNGNLVVEDCIFEGNYAGQASDPVYGSAIFISCGTAHIKRSKFTKNTTSGSGNGGAIAINYNNAGAYGGVGTVDLIVDSCLFIDNTNAASRDLYAAAPYVGHFVNVKMRDCQFLTGGNFNIVNNEPAEVTISVTYFGTAPTNSGTTTKTLSTNNLYTPNPTVPSFAGICGSIVLPVEVKSFTAKCDNISADLNWSTNSERNNDYFMVDKATSDGVFHNIAKIKGNGNSSTLKKYNFSDLNALAGTSYYRLSQVDFDGKSEILQSIALENTCLESQKTLSTCYFNASSNEVVINSNFNDEIEYDLKLVNSLGQIISQTEFKAHNKSTNHVLPLNQVLSNAVYFVIIEGNMQKESVKVVIY